MRMVMVVVAVVACACGGPSAEVVDGSVDVAIDADEGVGFRVLLNVAGVRDPLALTLRDGVEEQTVLLTEDSIAGTFRFPRRLPDGRDYSISVGGTQTCVSSGLDGVVAGTDAMIDIVCDGVIDLHAMRSMDPAVPLRFQPRFDPFILSYADVSAPLLLDPGSITPLEGISRYQTVTLTPSSVQWPATGSVTVATTLAHAGFAGDHTYTFTMNRDLELEGFGKASDPTAQGSLGGVADGNLTDVTGHGIAISGDTLVVGAPGAYHTGPNTGSEGAGAAYVFRRTGTTWAFEAKIPAPVANANFGTAVAIDGGTIVVGAPKDGPNGAAYIFERNALNQWPQVLELRPSGLTSGIGQDGAQFGASVAIAGTFLAASAPTHGPGRPDGIAFVFRHDAVEGWRAIPDQMFASDAGLQGEHFGSALAITGSRLAIGASFGDAAYAFSLQGGTWQRDTRISIPAAAARFGEAVALDGDLLVVGAPLDDLASGFNQGKAYVYRATGTTWTPAQTLVGPAQSAAQFGFAVAVVGHHIAVTAPLEDAGGPVQQGRIYYFRCTDAGVCVDPPERSPTAFNGSSQGRFGTSVAMDGVTIVTAAANEDTAATNSGAFYVFR